MKPTQEQILNSLSKLIKSEGKVKVELALLDSTEKYIGDIYNDIDAGKVILNKAGDKAENLGKTVILKAEGQLDKMEQAGKMAKELGVDVPEIKTFTNRLNKAVAAGKELVKKGADAMRL